MISEVTVPKLGETDVYEYTLARWLKEEGGAVRKGEPLFEITTDKTTLEAEAYADGVLRKKLFHDGEKVTVGTVIGIIAGVGEEIPPEKLARKLAPPPSVAAGAPSLSAAPASGTAAPAPGAGSAAGMGIPPPARTAAGVPAAVAGSAATQPIRTFPAGDPSSAAASAVPGMPAAQPAFAAGLSGAPIPLPPSARGGRIFASPRARMRAAAEHVPWRALRGTGPGGRIVERDVAAFATGVAGLEATPAARVLAAERGVDIGRIKGSGPGGRILEEDVAAAPELPPEGAFVRKKLSPVRRIIAERMTYSAQYIPQFVVSTSVDGGPLQTLRKRLSDAGVRVTPTDVIVKACALAMRRFPDMAAVFDGDAIVLRGDINIGVAVSIEGGLIVPVIRNADRLPLAELASRSRALVEKARAGRLLPDEYRGGVFTVSNMGMLDVERFAAIVQPGETGILAVGRLREMPVGRDGAVVPGLRMEISLSADHRVVDGAYGAMFLGEVKRLLESPAELER
ncbi:MAG: 2-oxo acid dehydrogenase subunit E2 [Planctomycetota bacterium]|nr:2-oxo acid dehydrogenase subunit E2 [Planctomycetota bacterium]